MSALQRPLSSLVRQPTPKRLPKAKAVTIGIGLLCDDGIVLCADTQISCAGYYKYDEMKLYWHLPQAWKAVFTFSGNPVLMKSFDGKFHDAMKLASPPFTAGQIHDVIEAILSGMDTVESDPDGLHMMCGIVIPSSEMRLLKTHRKIVTTVEAWGGVHDYVGVGDSSVLRYLGKLLAGAGIGTIRQALILGVYLTLQAKRYVDGCGGDTNVIVLRRDGTVEHKDTVAGDIEKHLIMLEAQAENVASAISDDVSDEDFEQALQEFCATLRQQRKSLGK